MTTWVLILVMALGSLVLKTIGPVLAGGREPPAPVTRVIALLAPVLITALIVTGAFADGDRLIVDARAAGLAVGGIALWLRAPVVVALVLAAAACALTRTIGT